jgi:hypothetical protein
MLAGEEVFDVDTGASGSEFEYQSCAIEFNGGREVVNVYDTTGLSRPDERKAIVSPTTLRALLDLLRGLGQISLLVFVTRFRITKETLDNYHLFRVVLGEDVPVVVAITGREFEVDDNEGWWWKNRDNFLGYGMRFDGYAIGTAKKRLAFDPAYAELRDGLRRLITSRYNQPAVLLESLQDCSLEKINERLKEVSLTAQRPRPRLHQRLLKALSCFW